MPADRWNIPFVNKSLLDYLENGRHKDYKTLIEAVVKDDSNPGAKWNLWTLLMNYDCAESEIKHASERIAHLYCADKNISKYLDECIMYNPKMRDLTISSKSRRDMKNDYSLSIYVDLRSHDDKDVDKAIATCKEVLTMMLVESKTVPYEKVDPEESKT